MPSNVDLLGFDEIEGTDIDTVLGDVLLGEYDEIMGAVAKKQNPALTAALATRAAQRGTIVKQTQARKARRSPIGIDSGAVAIAAGAQQVITITPQKPFRPEGLIVDPGCAPNFLILDVRVGTDSQFVSAAAIPASIFVPNSMNIGLRGDTCNPGISITISVQNISLAASRFLGGLVGTALGY